MAKDNNIRREFNYTRPILYNGEAYPSADSMISDGNGKETKGRIFADADGQYYTLDSNGSAVPVMTVNNLDEVNVSARNKQTLPSMFSDYLLANTDNVQVNNLPHREYNTNLQERGLRGAKEHALWDKEHPNLSSWRDAATAVPLAVAAVPAVIGGSSYLGGTALGQAAIGLGNKVMANPLVDMANNVANLGFAGIAGYDISQGKFTPGTVMDLASGLVNPRVLAGIDVTRTTLTGKSRDWMKPLVRDYIGEAYYNNIRPSGYANNDLSATSRIEQIGNMVKDILKPKLFRENVSDTNYMPKWIVDKNNPTVFEMFRNDAHRLSMGLDPHQELLPDGQLHSLYVKKPNGNYDVDWDYIRHVKQNYSDTDGRAKSFIPTDFPRSVRYVEGSSPSDGRVVSNDLITMNGGFGTYIFNPNKVHSLGSSNYLGVSKEAPTHMSTGDVTFMDTWDVQPFKDARSFAPGLSSYLTNVEDKGIPLLSNMAKNSKNVELVDALGGKPFIQESKLPDQLIYWYKPKATLNKQLSKNKDKFQTLNW